MRVGLDLTVALEFNNDATRHIPYILQADEPDGLKRSLRNSFEANISSLEVMTDGTPLALLRYANGNIRLEQLVAGMLNSQ
jgi:hypothetical protein